MDQKPKSIWKKSWNGPRGLFLWFISLTAAAFIIFVSIGVVSGRPYRAGLLVLYSLLSAIIVGLAAVMAIAFFRWVWCWRNFKRFLFGAACLATLIALFYAEENWRGKTDWENYKREWEAKGEKFDWESFIPAPVPDDQNFAMSPVWIARIKYNFLNSPEKAEAWYSNRIDGEDVSKFLPFFPMTTAAVVGTNWANRWPSTPDISGNWAAAGMIDLKPWQSYYRDLEKSNHAADISITPQPQTPAADVLLALSKFDPVIGQLRQDSQLPYSRFPVQYDDADPAAILLPHLAAVKQTAQVLELRAIAELQNGQPDKASDDVKLIFSLVNSVRTEPIIITHLVRMAVMQMAVQVIYEGLSRHQWSDAQLAEMDSELAGLDYLADYQLSVRGERAAHIKLMAWMSEKRSRYLMISGFMQNDLGQYPGEGMAAEFYLMPRGWFYQGDIIQAQAHQNWLSLPVDDAKQIVYPAQVLEASNKVDAVFAHLTAFNLLARLLTPELTAYAKRTAYNQVSADLARTAIALERYRLAHGAFPDSLDALAPQFAVPHDVINGGPLHYRLTPDGQFVLYSVGWNGIDDGGVTVFKKEPGAIYGEFNMSEGDWVWRYPEK